MKNYFRFDKSLNLRVSEGPKPEKKTSLNNLLIAKYSNLGYYLITPILIGVFLGLYLKGRLGTDYPVVIGIVIGTIGSIYNLLRIIKQ